MYFGRIISWSMNGIATVLRFVSMSIQMMTPILPVKQSSGSSDELADTKQLLYFIIIIWVESRLLTL